MTNPIHQWLEGKKKFGDIKHGPCCVCRDCKNFHEDCTCERNRVIDDLIADSPSLLSAMEAEIKEKVPEDEFCEEFDMEEGNCGMCASCKVNAANARIHTIITNYFNDIRG